MKTVDFIIIGQGIAGTTIAIRLLEVGKSVVIIDEFKSDTASTVSSGILNPITGRRYVKSWLFDEFLKESIQFYCHLEKTLNARFFQPHTVLRGLHNARDENLWFSQSAKPDYTKYFGKEIISPDYLNHFNNEVRFGEVQNSYRLDMPHLIHKAREYFINLDVVVNDRVEIEEIEFGRKLKYDQIEARGIIFAEGWKVIGNSLFNQLPFTPVKGEVLICKIENYTIPEILKNKKFILPIGNDKYWIGSTNEWEFNDERQNPEKQEELISFLEEDLNRNYSIISRHTAVRPSTKNRRPFLGTHPKHHNVYLFNGLGTKGVSMAPYMSKMLLEHIISGIPIMPELDVARLLA